MNIVISIDSFKGSLSSMQAADAIAAGARAAIPDSRIAICPLADGGEGTVDALVAALGAEYGKATVSDPLGRPIEAAFALTPDGKTAIIEMSAAAGITLVEPCERDPRIASTYGVGELILAAIARGARHFLVGIGGSATNDAGIGMLAALGFKFLDQQGAEIDPRGPIAAGRVAKILADGVKKEVLESTFSVACDVKNPLCGENGCSAVYGPQKGADAAAVAEMDAALSHFAAVTAAQFAGADPDTAGAGAAGGLGFAFLAFLGGKLLPGAELVTKECGLEELVRDADVVVTGEGKIDFQSAMGKAPAAVAALAKTYGKHVIAFCGAIDQKGESASCPGIDAIFPIPTGAHTLAEAMDIDIASRNLRITAEQVFRVIALYQA